MGFLFRDYRGMYHNFTRNGWWRSTASMVRRTDESGYAVFEVMAVDFRQRDERIHDEVRQRVEMRRPYPGQRIERDVEPGIVYPMIDAFVPSGNTESMSVRCV